MEHKTEQELASLLAQAATQVKVGGAYTHYKGNQYIVENVAVLEVTNEVVVIYRALYDKRLLFVRPLSIWLERVEYQGRTVPRFAVAE